MPSDLPSSVLSQSQVRIFCYLCTIEQLNFCIAIPGLPKWLMKGLFTWLLVQTGHTYCVQGNMLCCWLYMRPMVGIHPSSWDLEKQGSDPYSFFSNPFQVRYRFCDSRSSGTGGSGWISLWQLLSWCKKLHRITEINLWFKYEALGTIKIEYRLY